MTHYSVLQKGCITLQWGSLPHTLGILALLVRARQALVVHR